MFGWYGTMTMTLSFPIRFRFEYTDRLQKRRTREGELWENYRITFKKLDLAQAGA